MELPLASITLVSSVGFSAPAALLAEVALVDVENRAISPPDGVIAFKPQSVHCHQIPNKYLLFIGASHTTKKSFINY